MLRSYFFLANCHPSGMVVFSKLLPSTNSKSCFLLDVTTIRSIHLPSLNITNLIPISAFSHYVFFPPSIIPNLFHFFFNSLPKCPSSMVQLYAGGSPELLVNITSRCHIQGCHTDSMKSSIVELFTPNENRKLANTTDQGCFCF